MSNRLVIVYCGVLTSLAAISIDAMLLAFSAMAADLGATYASVQLTVPVFLFSTGLGQLVAGPVCDRYGRRPVILVGLALFIAGAALSSAAPTIEAMLAGRAAQGLGCAVGPVVGRAIIRDLYSGLDLARNLSIAAAVFAVGPIVAPLIGAALMEFASWRAIFALMIVVGCVLWVICLLWLPETIPARQADAMRPKTYARNIATLFSHPVSRFYLLLSGAMMSIVLIILTNAPAIYDVSFGITGTLFAILFALHGFGIIAGQAVNRRLIGRIGILPTIVAANAVLVVITAVMLGMAAAGVMSALSLSLLLVAHATSYLIVYSNANSLTLDPHGSIAGFTSSFFGFVSQVVGAIIAAVVSFFILGDLVAWTAWLLAITVVTFVVLAWRWWRVGDE